MFLIMNETSIIIIIIKSKINFLIFINSTTKQKNIFIYSSHFKQLNNTTLT